MWVSVYYVMYVYNTTKRNAEQAGKFRPSIIQINGYMWQGLYVHCCNILVIFFFLTLKYILSKELAIFKTD